MGLGHRHELARCGETEVDPHRGRLECPDHDAAAVFVDVRAEQRKRIAVATGDERRDRRVFRTGVTHGHVDPVPLLPIPPIYFSIVAFLTKSSFGKSLFRYALPSL